MNEPTFETYVIDALLSNNNYGITEVNSLKGIKSIPFDKDVYMKIVEIILRREIDLLQNMPTSNNSFESLDIMEFLDQNMKKYIVTVYSNDSLESDPQLIEVFKFSE